MCGMQKNRRAALWLMFDVAWNLGWPILAAFTWHDDRANLLGFFLTYTLIIGLRLAWRDHQHRTANQ